MTIVIILAISSLAIVSQHIIRSSVRTLWVGQCQGSPLGHGESTQRAPQIYHASTSGMDIQSSTDHVTVGESTQRAPQIYHASTSGMDIQSSTDHVTVGESTQRAPQIHHASTSGMDIQSSTGHVTVPVTPSIIDQETSTQVSDQFCQQHFYHEKTLPDSDTSTNWSDWRFTEKHNCPIITLKENATTWKKVSLSCKTGQPILSLVMAASPNDVMTVPHNDACLVSYLQRCCRHTYRVPNVVNYVCIGSNEFGFFQFISFVSVLRFMKPCLFLIHGSLPFGVYWDYFRSLVPNVLLVNRTTVEYVYGQKLRYLEHSSDIMRIEAVQAFGGYYLDWDQILHRSVHDLRNHTCTLSQEIPNYLAITFVMGERNSTFLRLWLEGYRDYKEAWGHNSMRVPYTIYEKYPDTVHVAGFKFETPNYNFLDKIYKSNFNWSENYGMHLYKRFYKNYDSKLMDLNRIRALNTTLGAICRHALFGDKELCQS